jgi:hypothetical protein
MNRRQVACKAMGAGRTDRTLSNSIDTGVTNRCKSLKRQCLASAARNGAKHQLPHATTINENGKVGAVLSHRLLRNPCRRVFNRKVSVGTDAPDRSVMIPESVPPATGDRKGSDSS